MDEVAVSTLKAETSDLNGIALVEYGGTCTYVEGPGDPSTVSMSDTTFDTATAYNNICAASGVMVGSEKCEVATHPFDQTISMCKWNVEEAQQYTSDTLNTPNTPNTPGSDASSANDFQCSTDDNNEDGSSAIEVVYLSYAELEIRKYDPSQLYSIENGGDVDAGIDLSLIHI